MKSLRRAQCLKGGSSARKLMPGGAGWNVPFSIPCPVDYVASLCQDKSALDEQQETIMPFPDPLVSYYSLFCFSSLAFGHLVAAAAALDQALPLLLLLLNYLPLGRYLCSVLLLSLAACPFFALSLPQILLAVPTSRRSPASASPFPFRPSTSCAVIPFASLSPVQWREIGGRGSSTGGPPRDAPHLDGAIE